MIWVTITFWTALFIVFYAYLGYGGLLFLLVKLKELFKPGGHPLFQNEDYTPEVTFIVAAYNEEQWIADKIRNCLAFDYPAENIQFWFVTDGSTDATPSLIKNYPAPQNAVIRLFHQPERRGKIAAVERVMPFVQTPFTIFTDANTEVNPQAIRLIVRHYQNPGVGAVAGEKRIANAAASDATGAGEGIYWRYESKLKMWDARLHSAVGAAGELFSIRTRLYMPVPHDTLIEDFVMTMNIAMQGFKIEYEPNAYAVEGQSAGIREELKRKIRIAAGGLQAAFRLWALLNPFRYGLLGFQYFSHRLLRWTLAPLALPILFLLNFFLAQNGSAIYQVLLAAQVIFYLLAVLGWRLERKKVRLKILFIPYYFCMMNYAMYRGFFRLITGRQSVVWEKSKRAA
ncbi:MAG: glycosyltransferase family 2 protein [Saprospiraceae bacterium]|nr:MAG: glycosyltransferase family 2 protein [Saprospiraceae bacterium]